MSKFHVILITLFLALQGSIAFRLKPSQCSLRPGCKKGSGWPNFFGYLLNAIGVAGNSSENSQNENTTVSKLTRRLGECVGSSPWLGIKTTASSHGKLVSDLAHQIAATMDNPALIDQRDTALCGPASFIHVMTIGNPVAYQHYVTQVFCAGPNANFDFGFGRTDCDRRVWSQSMQGGWLDEEMKTTSSPITSREYQSDLRILRAADFVALTAMRGSNSFMQQLTFPNTMKKWVEDHLPVDSQLGSMGRTVFGVLAAAFGTNRVSTEEMDALTGRISQSRGRKVAILLIGQGREAAVLPTHWLVLHGMSRRAGACIVWTNGKYQLFKYDDLRTYTFMAVEVNYGDNIPESRLAQISQAMGRDLLS